MLVYPLKPNPAQAHVGFERQCRAKNCVAEFGGGVQIWNEGVTNLGSHTEERERKETSKKRSALATRVVALVSAAISSSVIIAADDEYDDDVMAGSGLCMPAIAALANRCDSLLCSERASFSFDPWVGRAGRRTTKPSLLTAGCCCCHLSPQIVSRLSTWGQNRNFTLKIKRDATRFEDPNHATSGRFGAVRNCAGKSTKAVLSSESSW